MRGRTPTLHCDGDDGMCGNWELDSYDMDAYSIDDIRVTRSHRALGWLSTDMDEDYCPKHVPTPYAPTTKETTP